MEDAKVKAATDAFELGSIMKPITVSIALKANECCRREGRPPLFDPNEKMDVTRTLFPGRKSRPLKAPHTALNLEMAIQKSSNTYMAQLADRIIEQFGKEWYRQMLIDTFGLATKTGVELPGETPGMLPRPGKLHANGALEWSKSTPYSLAFGYNLMATSLQMARAYSVIANGGILVEPTLVRQVVKQKSDGSKCVLVDNTRSERQMQFPRVFGKEQANLVKRAMKYTTQAGGTGCLAAINGYTEAGKTGTAEKLKGGQYAHRVHISSFIGMAPANLDEQIKTRFVLIVTIDEPAPIFLEGGLKNYLGGRCAAPVFKEIARRSLEYMGETPDDPHGYPSKDPRYDPELADWAPEVKALKLLYDQWNRR